MEFKSDEFYYISGDRLNKLQALMIRLYSENRMNGDEMRNAAQFIDVALSDCQEMGTAEEFTKEG